MDIKYFEIYDGGVEIMTEDEEFYYIEPEDKEEIKTLKRFQIELEAQLAKEEKLSFEEKIKRYLMTWKD